MEKINVAELLKDCPKGMELDCTMFNNPVYLNYVLIGHKYSIEIETKNGDIMTLTDYGTYADVEDAKCVIFPKGKTTWKGFVPPIEFKDGDIVATTTGSWIGITAGGESGHFIPTYCAIKSNDEFEAYFDIKEQCSFSRLATEEEKQKLFDAIKENGYRWNAETKTLEKLIKPKFKVGDKVKSIFNNCQYIIKELTDTHYTLVEVIDKFQYTEPIIEDKNWELVPNKYDITTLKPFDKVLTRTTNGDVWGADLFGWYKDGWFLCNGHIGFRQCIPYKENEHLLGTTNDCDEFYKTWEE